MPQQWRSFLFGLFVGLLSVALILLLNKPPSGKPITLLPPPPTPSPVPLRVHIIGAVRAPGLYELSPGSVLQDAVHSAGGLADSAATDSLNLAALLSDGQQLYIPFASATPAPTNSPSPNATPQPNVATPTAISAAAPASGASGQLININTATQAQLESLPRIGPAIATRILDYRATIGAFTSIEQIMNVRGIGNSTFNAIKDLITVR